MTDEPRDPRDPHEPLKFLDLDDILYRVAQILDRMRKADARLVLDSLAANDDGGARVAQLLRDYYSDRARADRTPREILYLHIGMLVAWVTDTPPAPTPDPTPPESGDV